MHVNNIDKSQFDAAWQALNQRLGDIEAQHGLGAALQALYDQQRAAGFVRDESTVFVEYHVMFYEERYAPNNWDYQHREIRRDEWDAATGELTKRERISQY